MFSVCVCFLSLCFLSLCFLSLCFFSLCVFSLCFLSGFSLCVFSVCVFFPLFLVSLFSKCLCPGPIGKSKYTTIQNNFLNVDSLALNIQELLVEIMGKGKILIFWPYPTINQNNCALATQPFLTSRKKTCSTVTSLFRSQTGQHHTPNKEVNDEFTSRKYCFIPLCFPVPSDSPPDTKLKQSEFGRYWVVVFLFGYLFVVLW